MKLNYINVITNNSIWVINRLSNLFRKRNYSIEAFSASFDEKWRWHILIWIQTEEDWELEQVISQIYKLFDVIKVENMEDRQKEIRYVFSVKNTCKKTLKRISREPDKIIETDKEWIYIFILKKKHREEFLSELNNLKLNYIQRVAGFTN